MKTITMLQFNNLESSGIVDALLQSAGVDVMAAAVCVFGVAGFVVHEMQLHEAKKI